MQLFPAQVSWQQMPPTAFVAVFPPSAETTDLAAFGLVESRADLESARVVLVVLVGPFVSERVAHGVPEEVYSLLVTPP